MDSLLWALLLQVFIAIAGVLIGCCQTWRHDREAEQQQEEEEARGDADADEGWFQAHAHQLAAVQLLYFPYAQGGGGSGASASSSTSVERLVCAICLEQLRHGELCSEVPACRHVFHRDCVALWIKRNNTCPLTAVQGEDNAMDCRIIDRSVGGRRHGVD